LVTGSPPTVLTDDDAGVERAVEPEARAYDAGRRLEPDPGTFGEPSRRRRVGMHLDLRIYRTSAQAGEGPVLGLAEHGRLGASEHKRITSAKVRPGEWRGARLDEVG